MSSVSETPAWRALEAHYAHLGDAHPRKLFAEDPTRGERFTIEAAGLYFHYCKHRVTA